MNHWHRDAQRRAEFARNLDTHIHIHFGDGTHYPLCHRYKENDKLSTSVFEMEAKSDKTFFTVPGRRDATGSMQTLTGYTCHACTDFSIPYLMSEFTLNKSKWRDLDTGEIHEVRGDSWEDL